MLFNSHSSAIQYKMPGGVKHTLHWRLVEIPLFFLGLTSRPGFQPKKSWLLCLFDYLANFLLHHALFFFETCKLRQLGARLKWGPGGRHPADTPLTPR